jgi:HK97 family phage major capsid protein
MKDDEFRFEDPLPHQLPANRGRYSFARAYRQLIDGGNRPVGGLEGEVSAELQKRTATTVNAEGGARGFMVPWDAEVRALDTKAAAGGIPTVLDRKLIDVLRPKLALARLGARVLPDLTGSGQFAMPRKTATVTLTYTTDGANAAPSNPAIGQQAVIWPATTGAYVDTSRKYLSMQPDGEAWVIEDITTAIGVEVERAATVGTGQDNVPLGLFQNPDIPNIMMGTNGAVPTYDAIVSMETAVANANGDRGRMGFLTSPNGRSALRRCEVRSGSGRFVWKDDQTVLGYQAEVSSNVPSNLTKGSGTNLSPCLLGNFDDVVIGLWGAVTVIVNPYIGSANGSVRTTVLCDFGVQMRQELSFAIIPDMVTS